MSAIVALGSLTVIPGAHSLIVVQCVLYPEKWLVHPDSATYLLLLAMTSIANEYLDFMVDNVIVLLVKILCLLVLLSMQFHSKPCVNPSILFDVVPSSLWLGFCVRHITLLW